MRIGSRAVLGCAALLMIAALSASADVKTEEGEMDGAPFRILMPEEWNGRLVLFAHGYSGTTQLSRRGVPLQKYAVGNGYAMAYSGYNETGWAVGSGVKCTEELRRYFVSKYGDPERTYITGASMGGTITITLMETYPDVYDGVKLYESDGKAVEYLLKHHEPTGEIKHPILAMHGTGDTLVPVEQTHRYEELLEKKGNGHLFVLKVIDRPGHVTFRAEEYEQAFKELVAWVEDGVKPTPGDITYAARKK